MFGQMGQLMSLMGRAKEIKANLEALKAELSVRRVRHSVSEGLISAEVDGHGQLLAVSVHPSARAHEQLESLVCQAVQAAQSQALAHKQSKIQEALGGVDLGEMRSLLGG